MKIYQALIVLLVLLERGNGFYVPSLGRLNHESAAVKTHGCGFREAMPMLPSWAIKGAVGDEEKNQSMEDLSGGANTMYDDLRESLKGTCIYLVGMMGKTAVGAGLAEKVGFRFIDSDEAAEWILEMPIADFFTQGPEKEAEFRELEYQVLMEMAQYTRVVVAVGGGAVTQNKNWGLLRHGIVIHLDMSVDDICARQSADPAQLEKQPLLRGDDPKADLRQILGERVEQYAQADVVVKVLPEDSVEAVVNKVCASILAFIAANPPFWQEKEDTRKAKGLVSAMAANTEATEDFVADVNSDLDADSGAMLSQGVALPKTDI